MFREETRASEEVGGTKAGVETETTGSCKGVNRKEDTYDQVGLEVHLSGSLEEDVWSEEEDGGVWSDEGIYDRPWH
jgi:hypothetical protein